MLFLQGHQTPVRHLAFSADGSLLASTAAESAVRIWDGTTGVCRDILPFPRLPTQNLAGPVPVLEKLVFAPQGEFLAALNNRLEVMVWDWPRPEPVLQLRTGGRALAFRSSGKELAIVRSPQFMRLAIERRDLIKGCTLPLLPLDHFAVWAMAYAPDDGTLALAGPTEAVQLWDLDNGKERASLIQPGHIQGLVYRPDSKMLAVNTGHKVALWNLNTNQLTGCIGGHAGLIWAVAFTPDGQLLATGSSDGVVKLWDPISGRQQAAFDWQMGRIHALAFSPDGMRAAAGGERDILIWDLDGL